MRKLNRYRYFKQLIESRVVPSLPQLTNIAHKSIPAFAVSLAGKRHAFIRAEKHHGQFVFIIRLLENFVRQNSNNNILKKFYDL